MGETNPSTQRQVLEYYKENSADAATVGDYVRVVEDGHTTKSCFGPTAERKIRGWHVVEIDWEAKEFVVAPGKDRKLDE